MNVAVRSKRGRSTERGAASREHILESAWQVLAERGYGGTSIAAICERADISPTSVYWHFGSKAGLFQALVESRAVLADFRSAVDEAQHPLDKLDRLLAQMRQLVVEQPLGSLTLVAMVSEGGHASPELLEAHKRSRKVELQAIADEFAAVLGKTVPDLDVVAVLLNAFSNYAALTYRVDPDGAELDAIFALLRRAMLRLLGPYVDLGDRGSDSP